MVQENFKHVKSSQPKHPIKYIINCICFQVWYDWIRECLNDQMTLLFSVLNVDFPVWKCSNNDDVQIIFKKGFCLNITKLQIWNEGISVYVKVALQSMVITQLYSWKMLNKYFLLIICFVHTSQDIVMSYLRWMINFIPYNFSEYIDHLC